MTISMQVENSHTVMEFNMILLNNIRMSFIIRNK